MSVSPQDSSARGLEPAVEDLLRDAAPRRIAVLGATGSVGRNTLDLVQRCPGAFDVEALTAHNNVEALAQAARDVGARFAVVGNPAKYAALKEALAGTGIEAGAGARAVVEAAQRPADWVMAAIVGAAGLEPAMAAVRRGATLALANKETLVCAGALMMAEVARHGATVLPVDSEHNAIFQVMDFEHAETVERIILTASGGPFRTFSRAALRRVTRQQAVVHPNWSMGAKISVDSATLMNKGLELIEAHHLFALPESRIEVLVHPQSIVHSLVAYRDGSVLAQLGTPDMRTPIAHTLAWPTRMQAPVAPLDLAGIGQLSFEAPDDRRFPALRLARQALQTGGTAPPTLNAANEVAVQAFLDDRIGFLDIPAVVERTLAAAEPGAITAIEDVGVVDAAARTAANRCIDRISA